MNQNKLGEFIYQNLDFVTDFSENTKLCIHKPSKKLYVVKSVKPGAEEYYKKLAEIDNPTVAKILYISEEGQNIKILREYISGDTLADLLKKKVFDNSTAAQIIAEICEGLSAIHRQGLVHRDITPNNIIISAACHPTIIDFGIIRSYREDKCSDTVIMGTPGYAAPEQFGFSQSNAQTDIYAVGVLLNVMLTGKLPNEQLADGSVRNVISKCTQIDSCKRYSSIAEVSSALKNRYYNHGSLDKAIQLIPGLRSKHIAVVIFSALAYIFAILITIAVFGTINGGFGNYFSTFIAWLLTFPIPFFCYHNFLGIWNKIPFTAGSSKRSQRIIYSVLGSYSIILGIIIFGITNSPK